MLLPTPWYRSSRLRFGLIIALLMAVGCGDPGTGSNPQAFRARTWLRSTAGALFDFKEIHGVVSNGTVIAIATGEGFVYVFDAAAPPVAPNPEAPIYLDTLDVPSVKLTGNSAGAGAVAIAGTTVYVARPDFTLAVIDVSNPEAPVLVAENIATGVEAAHIARVADDRLLITNQRGEYALFDARSHPPTPLAVDKRMDALGALAFTGDRAYAIEPGGIAARVWMFDAGGNATAGTSFSITGIETGRVIMAGLAVHDGVLYVASASVVAAFDLGDPASPVQISTAQGMTENLNPEGPNTLQQLTVFDDQYLVAPTFGTYPYDLSTPAAVAGTNDWLGDDTADWQPRYAVARHTYAAASNQQIWVGDRRDLLLFGP